MIVPIILTAFGLGVAALIALFYIKKSKEKPVEPIEPVQPEEPEKPEQPQKPDELEIPPVEPEEPTPEPEPDPIPEPEPEPEPQPECDYFKETIEYYKDVTMLEDYSMTYDYLKSMYEAYKKINLRKKDLFPVIFDYYTETENQYAKQQEIAWYFAMILTEILPEKRNIIYQKAYDYCTKGAKQATFSYSFETDPNISRLIASAIWAYTRKPLKIKFLRKEQGTSSVRFNKEIDELYIKLTAFMPHAPGPYLNTNRVKPVGTDSKCEYNTKQDQEIHEYISKYYNLSSEDDEKRQRTIQAIADKDGDVLHLFGPERYVEDPEYGEMTIYPVFGKHNIGIEIPTDGAIANMIDQLSVNCSWSRDPLLNQEYGRRRPGMGKKDGTRNSDPNQRALVNYAIEEGDGHTTGYYNKDGEYIYNDGSHIGDYVDYFQKQLYANSYPSGHSAYIWGTALFLIQVMPDRMEQIIKAANEFAMSRTIARYHWTSDTIHGRVVGSMFVPILHSVENYDTERLVDEAKKEYKQLIA